MEGWRWCWKIWNRKLPNCPCWGGWEWCLGEWPENPNSTSSLDPQSFTYQSCIPTKYSQFCSCCSDFSLPILHFKKNRMFFKNSRFSQIFTVSKFFLKFFSFFSRNFFSKILEFFSKILKKNSQKNPSNF